MRRLATRDLWPKLHRLARKAKRRMAAVAYVTRAAEVRFGAGDILVVDASDQAIKSGVTSAAILRAAHRRGAQVFSCSGLHAKVLLLGDVAVVGSANISTTSVNQKIEAALITNDRATTSRVRSLIHELAHQSLEIDDAFLRRISKIKVSKRNPESSRRKDVPTTASRSRKPDLPASKVPNWKESTEERARRERVSRAVVRHGIHLNKPHALPLRNKTFVFTGSFEFGTQDECARATHLLGGHRSPSNNVTRLVDVLVVGTRGSPTYLWKNYGTKMVRANELRRQSGKPLIVTEDRWRKEIGY